MIGATYAQWLILIRRPLLWALAVTHLLLLLVQFLLPVLTIKAASQLSAMQQGGAQLLPPEAIEQLRIQALFPGAFAAAFGQINSVGGLLLMIFAGAFIGADFNWGTARTLLIRRPRRSRYLLSKVLALLPLAAALVVVTLVLGLLLGMLNHAILNEPISISPAHTSGLVFGAARSFYGLLPYMLLAVTFAAVGRSTLAGVGGSLLFWIVEVALGILSFLPTVGSLGKQIYDLTLSQNVAALTELTRRSFGIYLEQTAGPIDLSFPPPGQAALLLLLYMLLLIGLSLFFIQRHDITGPR